MGKIYLNLRVSLRNQRNIPYSNHKVVYVSKHVELTAKGTEFHPFNLWGDKYPKSNSVTRVLSFPFESYSRMLGFIISSYFHYIAGSSNDTGTTLDSAATPSAHIAECSHSSRIPCNRTVRGLTVNLALKQNRKGTFSRQDGAAQTGSVNTVQWLVSHAVNPVTEERLFPLGFLHSSSHPCSLSSLTNILFWDSHRELANDCYFRPLICRSRQR